MTEFTRQRWRPWADSVIRATADPVAAATSNLTGITRDEKNASDTVLKLTDDVMTLDKRIASEEDASRIASAQREALRDSQAYQDAVSANMNAQQLAERADQAEDLAEPVPAACRRRAGGHRPGRVPPRQCPGLS